MRVWSVGVCVCLSACAASGGVAMLPGDGAVAARDGVTAEAATSDAATTDVMATDAVATPDVAAEPDVVETDVPEAVRVRPYTRRVPSEYDPSQPTPLVVLLHGYGVTGATQDLYFHMSALAERRTFLLAIPDGTPDATMSRYWNATDACCDFAHTNVDDVGYVMAIIDDMSARYRVDPRRVFLVGHSNGGFLAHRIACDRSDRIAGIVSLAGATWNDPARCAPTSPVAVLQVHGTADAVIAYNGGATMLPGAPGAGGTYPAARTSVARWAGYNRCDTSPTRDATRLDVDGVLLGAETTVDRHARCAGGAAELWTIENGTHIPALVTNWPTMIYDFLMAHPRP